MRIALAQTNSKVGDFAGNRAAVLALSEEAARLGADLALFPEMALCGYPPMDLLDQPSFAEACLDSLRELQKALRSVAPGLAVAVGYVDRNPRASGKGLTDSVAVLQDGELVFRQDKTLLPTYDVFDEARWFEPATERLAFDFKGLRLGFAICEDIWGEEPQAHGASYPLDPLRELADRGVDIILVPSASPFHAGKLKTRLRLASGAAKRARAPVVYCNMAGGNDSLVFDGRSFSLDAKGRLSVLAGWDEGLLIVDPFLDGALPWPEPDRDEEIHKALVVGTRDYVGKCGFKRAAIGLSGGIDSALVAAVAVEALGPDNVACVSMPSRFSSEGSRSDAAELSRRLGCSLETLAIEGPFQAYLDLLAAPFQHSPFGLTEENLQARIRGAILMAWSNRFGSLVLTTGNKSELATGYCTLYGDMCGALAVIGDLLKTEVFSVCRSWNRDGEIIPRAIIDKPPSAELRPNQLDQDSLPPYDVLDGILEPYLVGDEDAEVIAARGYDRATVERVMGMVARAEYKRRQAAPVIRVSPRAFGMGRRLPVARSIHETER